ncbi:DUF4276 family protein [Gloeobacter morelensis]|uniref:DUF4276 family protein n=1 Tax=Gloeobacter morelensis MG652769 TaxID=2781736 RepID=A0ABY3PPI4_9CYAN|nr:DUF4276 family protein [Gloeobacter morelensis]UFP95524.1 DUF4276 family protein [Gloeobacter morelensis MG652769]
MRIVFLLEERSMKEALDVILPKLIPNVEYLLVSHEGKSDLDSSIPRKLKGWQHPDDHFVILRDKDSSDCRKLKEKYVKICEECGRPDTLVRIVCHHLESWFLGDLSAVEKAFLIQGLAARQSKRKYRNPDSLANASDEISKLVSGYGKVLCAREIALHLSLEEGQNKSRSFQVFIEGIFKG